MVRKPGSKHSEPSSRVTARRNDWNSIRDLHQGPRSLAAFRGRIHDRSPIRCRTTKKPLPRGGRPYMTEYTVSGLATRHDCHHHWNETAPRPPTTLVFNPTPAPAFPSPAQ